MGLFDELNELGALAGEADNPDAIKSGTYPALIKSHKIGPTKNGDKIGCQLQFVVDGDRMDDDDPKAAYSGRTLQSWQQFPTPDTVRAAKDGNVQAQRVRYYWTQWMNNLGFTAEDRANLSEELFERLDQMEVIIEVKAPEGDGFPQVTSIRADTKEDDFGVHPDDDLGGIDL